MRSPRRSQATSIRRSAGRLRRADDPRRVYPYEALLSAITRSEGGLWRSLASLEEAIAMDPEFALGSQPSRDAFPHEAHRAGHAGP